MSEEKLYYKDSEITNDFTKFELKGTKPNRYIEATVIPINSFWLNVSWKYPSDQGIFTYQGIKFFLSISDIGSPKMDLLFRERAP